MTSLVGSVSCARIYSFSLIGSSSLVEGSGGAFSVLLESVGPWLDIIVVVLGVLVV